MGNASSDSITLADEVSDRGQSLETTINDLVTKKAWDKVAQIFRDNPTISFTSEKSSRRLPLHRAILKHAPLHLIKTLVTANALAVNVLDAAGESPVHYAITSKVGLDIIRALTEANNTCMEISDTQGLLPLHKALEYKAPPEVVLHVLKSYPDGAFERTKDGKLPLHYACENQASIQVVKLLLELNEDATGEAHHGRLPIHYACEHKPTLELISLLHGADEQAITTKGIDAMYPLHMAVTHRAPVAVVEYLVQTYPDALLHRDRRGLHPIHYAIERNAPDSLVRCILTHHPITTSFRGKGSPGNFPLSTALDKHYSSDIVRMILQAYPQAAAEPNMLRFLPLQTAIKHNVSDIALLTDILHAYPDAAKATDDHGRVILHYSASRSMDLGFVQCLLDAHPAGAAAKDKNEQIALHLAVTRLCEMPLINKLLQFHRNGVLDVDRYGMNPLNYAVENNASVELVCALISANALCARHIISHHRTVLHQAVEFRRDTEVVKVVVQAFPGACAVQESVQGRLPLHWAIERLLPLPTLLCIDEANPVEGAYIQDHRGWRSTHYAIHHPTPTPLVIRLLLANSAIAKIRDDPLHTQYYTTHYPTYYTTHYSTEYTAPVVADKEAFLLLHYAICHDALPETVAEIMLYTMPFSTAGAFNAHHYDTWHYIMAHSNDRYWRSVDIVLTHYEQHQNVITQLAEFRDQATVRCIDVATPRSLHEILRRMHYYSRYEMHKKLALHKSKYSLVHSAIYHNTVFGATIVNNPTNVDSLHNSSSVKNSQTSNTTNTTHTTNTTPAIHTTHSTNNDTVSTPAVLKFTSQRSKFIREVIVRTKNNLNTDYVIQMMASHNAQEDLKYGAEIAFKGFTQYPFLMVFKQGDRDLGGICKHEHMTGSDVSDLPLIRSYMVMILQCVQHLHQSGVVHGDIKPSNIIRESGRLKLANLGAACQHSDRELVSAELQQLAYAAPELAHLQRYYDTVQSVQHAAIAGRNDAGGGSGAQDPHFTNAAAQLLNPLTNTTDIHNIHPYPTDLTTLPSTAYTRIMSHPSQDMWSVGAVFYLLLTGECLFLNNVSEDVDSDQIDLLTEWPEFVKARRLEKVKNVYARALLSQLLSKDPARRPSAEYCLRHVFCTGGSSVDGVEGTMGDVVSGAVSRDGMGGGSNVRFVGIPAEYDVYVCYRRLSLHSTAVDAPLILENTVEEAVAQYTDADVPPPTDTTPDNNTNNTTNNTTIDAPKSATTGRRKESALNRMFGNISISDSEMNEDESEIDENSIDNNSADDNGSANVESPTVNVTTAVDINVVSSGVGVSGEGGVNVLPIDTSTDDGKYSLLQQYCRDVGLSAAPTATCVLSTPHDNATPRPDSTTADAARAAGANTEHTSTAMPPATHTTINNTTSAARDTLLTKCSAAVIILTKDTWKCLEDKCAALVKEHNNNSNSSKRGSAKHTTNTTNSTTTPTNTHTSTTSTTDTILQDQLLDDFLYELRLIIELLSLGLLEKGVYVYAVGSAVDVSVDSANVSKVNPSTHPTNNTNTTTDRILDSYFQHYMGNMIGRYGNAHPPSSMPHITLPAIETRISHYLQHHGYGVVSSHANLSLYEMFRFLVRFPTFHIIGPEREAFRNATENLLSLISGTGRINRANSEEYSGGYGGSGYGQAGGGMSGVNSLSRPNTGAFNMLRNSRLGSPQVLSRVTSAHNRSFSAHNINNNNTVSFHNGGLYTNTNSSSFSYNNLGSANIGSIAAGITAGINSGILSIGNTVPRTMSRGYSSGRMCTPLTNPYTPNTNTNTNNNNNNSVVMNTIGNITLPSINTTNTTHHTTNTTTNNATNNNAVDYYRPARSPVTGLRVRAYTPTKSPKHVNYTDITNTANNTAHNTAHNSTITSATGTSGDAYRGQSPPRRPTSGLYAGGGSNGSGGANPRLSPLHVSAAQWGSRSVNRMTFNNNHSDHNIRYFNDSNAVDYPLEYPFEQQPLENEVTFYNNQDIVTVPYFTEIVGEDRVRTANAMVYMSTKLEESENTIANLEDELTLLRRQMHQRDAELSKLRSVVRANSQVQPTLPAPGRK